MSYYESRVASVLIYHLEGHVTHRNKLGIVLAPDAMQRFVGQVRLPDVAFVSWDRFPGRRLPRSKILNVGIDLAIEVLSEGNTDAEMLRKRREYFASGAKQVWEIDPEEQTARIYTSATKYREVGPDGTLEGGKIIPGFALTMAKLFDEAGPRA
jgi:Uma2 family endonuclease